MAAREGESSRRGSGPTRSVGLICIIVLFLKRMLFQDLSWMTVANRDNDESSAAPKNMAPLVVPTPSPIVPTLPPISSETAVAVGEAPIQEAVSELVVEVQHPTGSFANCSSASTQESDFDPQLHNGSVTVSCLTMHYRIHPSFCEAAFDLQYDPIKLVVGVLTLEREPRQAVRETWGQMVASNLYFIVGGLYVDIEQEFNEYGDMIWLDKKEAFEDLTYKVGALFSIIDRHCNEYSHVLKTDDDSFVNIRELSHDIRENEAKGEQAYGYFGNCKESKLPHRPESLSKPEFGKYALTTNEYPEELLPSYCIGLGYVVSRSFASCIKEEAAAVRYLKFEDAAVGVLAERCQVSVPPPLNDWTKKRWISQLAAYNRKDMVDKVIHHRVNHTEMREEYKMIATGSYRNCTKDDKREASVFNSSLHDGSITVSCLKMHYKLPVRLRVNQTFVQEDYHPIKMAIGVLSLQHEKRVAVRETWGKFKGDQNLYFIVGGPFDLIKDEFEEQDDMIWIDKEERYEDLTYKVGALIAILHRKSNGYTHIFKTDDDTYVNLHNLRTDLEEGGYGFGSDYHGKCLAGYKPLRPSDDVKPALQKFVINWSVYPEEFYPPYCAGLGYVVSKKFASCIDNQISKVRYHPFEDVAMGLLSERCDVHVRESTKDESKTWVSQFLRQTRQDMSRKIVHHPVNQTEMYAEHRLLVATAAGRNCSKDDKQEASVFNSNVHDGSVVVSCLKMHYKLPKMLRTDKTYVMPGDDPIKLVVGVLTLQRDGRQAVRETWGEGQSHLFFIIGGPFADIEVEFYEYGDMIWLDKTESYLHLTYKVGALLSILDKHITGYTHLFKTDDDTFLNLENLRSDLEVNNVDYYGRGLVDPVRPIRTTYAVAPYYLKFVVNRTVYPDEFLPAYCEGAGYAVSSHFAACIQKEAAKVRFMPFEDVAVGLMAVRCHIHASVINGKLLANWINSYKKVKARSMMKKILHHPLNHTMMRLEHELTLQDQKKKSKKG